MKLAFSSLINFGFSASTGTIREGCPDLDRNEACKGVCFNQAKMCLGNGWNFNLQLNFNLYLSKNQHLPILFENSSPLKR